MWWKFLKRRPGETAEDGGPDSEELRTSGRAPLSEVAKRVKEIELVTKKKSSAILSGDYKSRFKGQGMQFSDSRLYQYGDDIRHIDWRTTARMQEAYVKTFEEERELNIVLAVDVSASSEFGSTGHSKRDQMALGLACLAFSAIAHNDRVGLILFTDRVERFVPARKGRKHVMRVIDELLSFRPASRGSHLDPALNFLSSLLKHGSVVVFASDFFSAFDRKKLQLLARKHDFICLKAGDPRDLEIPDIGLLQVEDLETGELVLLPTSSAALRRHYSESQSRLGTKLEELLLRTGASICELSTGEDPVKALRSFFHARKRKSRR